MKFLSDQLSRKKAKVTAVTLIGLISTLLSTACVAPVDGTPSEVIEEGSEIHSLNSSLRADGFEPNNSLAQATPLKAGRYPDLTLTSGDWDYFLIEVAEYTTVTLRVDYDSNQGRVSQVLRRYSPTTTSIQSFATRNLIEVPGAPILLAPGKYQIILSSDKALAYDLTYQVVSAGLSEDRAEPNNDPASAFELGERGEFNLHDARDVDFYRITIPGSAVLVDGVSYFKVSLTESDQEVTFNLWSGDGREWLKTLTGKDLEYQFGGRDVGKSYLVAVKSKVATGYRISQELRLYMNSTFPEADKMPGGPH